MKKIRQANVKSNVPQGKNLVLTAFYGTYQTSRNHEGKFS